MKIFAAINDPKVIKLLFDKTGVKMNILISYFYLKGSAYKLTHEYRNMIKDLILDSGAYSVYTGKSQISVTEYCMYLKLYGHLFDAYFNLDDKFEDIGHNQWNQKFIVDHLPKDHNRPVPVVHDIEKPFNEFQHYADLGHEYIAIGSTTPLSDETFDKIKTEYPAVRLHMFGTLKREMLFKHRPYSADASTFFEVAAHGSIMYLKKLNDNLYKEFKIYLGAKDKKEDQEVHYKKFGFKDELEAFLKQTFNFEYTDLLKPSGAINRQIVNLYFYHQLEEVLNNPNSELANLRS